MKAAALAAATVVAIIVIVYVAKREHRTHALRNFGKKVLRKAGVTLAPTGGPVSAPFYMAQAPYDQNLTQNAVDSLVMGGNDRALSPESQYDPRQTKGIYDSLNTLYSTADVDPLIMGQGYEYRDNTRPVYANRTAVGGEWGLQEFAPDSTPGAVGVDVGPNMLSEYEGSALGYNDGIPEQWAFPSTPIRWYTPADPASDGLPSLESRNADYLARAGPAMANGETAYPLWEPDHDPLIG